MILNRVRRGGLTLVALMGLELLAGQAVAGDYAVIVNRQNPNAVDRPMVLKIYLGELKTWADGTRIVAFDLPEDNAVRINFSNQLMGKAVTHLRAYWAQLTFSGRAMPPRVLATDDEVKKSVQTSPGAIGYISAASIDDSIKVIMQ